MTRALLLLACAAASASAAQMKPNHLIREKSPYLIQHARNPVDWYPWGEEAFARAKKEDKPIFLSIGYATCHWCHVMEQESFENPDIAARLNRDFVAIKVDREERPDVDRVYMTAVQTMTGQGGWPLNAFLTPQLKPFFGGTYFPPEGRDGQPGFPSLLQRVAQLWKERRADVDRDADRLCDALKAYASSEPERGSVDAALLERAERAFAGAFDPDNAGFGGAPKFPMPVNQAFLLRFHARTGSPDALRLAADTLSAMARGGVYDQLGGGFHRYSTDAQWRVPHFEKMLYDNAQLAVNYLEAYQAVKDPEFARAARETLDYVLRDMSREGGGYFSAEDADSLAPGAARKSEGAFYLWTERELEGLLGADADLVIYRYGVKPGGNALADPHGELAGKNVLYAKHTVADCARRFKLKPEEAGARLEKARAKLLAARAKRPRPGLDDKILTSWNGLMLSAMAKGYQVLGDEKYLTSAQRTAAFIEKELYHDGRLWHRWRDGERAVPGMADDYSFLISGLLDLHEADFDPRRLEWAAALAKKQQELFGAPAGGLYLTAEGSDPSLLMRVVEDSDNVEPSASAVAALDGLRLAQFTGDKAFAAAARNTLERFAREMKARPMSLAQMLSAADWALSKPVQIVIAGRAEEPGVKAMLAEVRSRFIPVKIVLRVDDENRARLAERLPFLKGVTELGGEPTAYVCENYACKLPTNDPARFKELLDATSARR